MRSIPLVSAIPVVAVLFCSAAAQTPRPHPARTPAPSIRSTTGLVLVPISVRDPSDAPVLGLPSSAFHIYEESAEQNIATFTEEEGPVSIGIVFDASRSMEPKLHQSRKAISHLFDRRLPGDEYLAVAFNDAPRRMCALTRDAEAVQSALASIHAEGWTSLYDGIYLSAKLMRPAANARRALLILSDGEDNLSRYSSAQVRDYLREANVTVYAIGLSGDGFAGLRGRPLRRLTEETGGWFHPVSALDGLPAAVSDISRAIRSQYVIGYYPQHLDTTGQYKRVRVTVDQPSGARYRVTWRSGYYPPL